MDFETVKRQIEAEAGPLTTADEIETKALYYFAKAVKLRHQLESGPGPERIGPIAERVFDGIMDRANRRQKRQAKVVGAVKDFMAGRTTHRRTNKRKTHKVTL